MDTPLESLLSHSAWVERLARRLVRDPEAADELVQETWLTVLEAGELPVRSARAWLATVLRSRLADRRRGAARRERHEQAGARAEAQASTEELFQRTAAQHEVVEAVLALDEPYREVILRRYFEGEPPRVIAARLGLPLPTVKTRLARGLARLRSTLDERHGGDGKRWMLALVPLVRRGRLAPAFGLLLAVGLVAGLVLAPFLLRSSRGASDGGSARLATAPEATTAVPAAPGRAVPQPGPARETLASGPAGAVPAGPGFALLVRGTLVDEHGAPLAGLVLELRPEDGSARRIALSGARGEFELTTTSALFAVHALDEQRVTAWAGLPDGVSDDLRVVAAPAVSAEGRVVDGDGAALVGVHVALELPPLPDAPASAPVDVRGATDARGEFRLEHVPDVPGAALVFSTPGYAARRLPLAERTGPLRVELAREGRWTALRGRVLDERGAPLAGAFVAGGASWTRAGADGSFELRAESPPAQILALAEGRRPVRTELEAPEVRADELELVLTEPALVVRGRVLDHDGTPLSGAWVWIDDPEPLVPPMLDAADDIDALPRPAGLGGPRLAVPLVEGVLAGAPEVGWRRVSTGPGGAFELGGLAARAYRLAALEPGSLRCVRLAGVPAGTTDAVLRFAPAAAPQRRLVRVRAPDGAALAGVRVTLERTAFRVPAAGAALWSERVQRPLALTDGEGRAELELPVEPELSLRFEGTGLFVRTLALAELAPDGALELERACGLSLRVAKPCVLAARDSADASCALEERSAGERRRRTRVPLAAGETRRFLVGEFVRALVLEDSSGGSRRVPVVPVPGAWLELEL